MNIITKLNKQGLLNGAPSPVLDPELEVIMGSLAYGVSGQTSDMDVYVVYIPKKEEVFPHLTGKVQGFYPMPDPVTSWQRHHMMASDQREYDVAAYSIVEYFRLAADNNPNIIDSLFVPARCVSFQSDIGKTIRENRKNFLNKKSYAKLRGYAISQMKKIDTRNPVGKRADLVTEHGWDVKFGYHTVRLIDECRQILMKGDLDIEENREELKAIRRGEWTYEKFKEETERRMASLDDLFLRSTLRQEPEWDALNKLLLVCLEIKFGKVTNEVATDASEALRKLEEIRKLVNQ
jgi:hypothetical protein